MRNQFANPRIVCAVLAALATSAFAQDRVGDQGHALDANNRIGSGGYNSASNISPRGQAATNGEIYHGNIGGLGAFQGNVQGFNPNSVNVNTETSASDNLNAIAAPQNLEARTTGAPQSNITPFYSTAGYTKLPESNFQQTPGGVGLVPAPVQTQKSSDLRLGVIDNVTTQETLPPNSEFNLAGPVDASGQITPMTASPVYGIRRWSTDNSSDRYFLSQYSNIQLQEPGQGKPLNNAEIRRMRNQLNSTIINPKTGKPNDQNANQDNNKNDNVPNGNGQNNSSNSSGLSGSSIAQQSNGPINKPLSNQRLNTRLNQSPESNSLTTNTGTRQTLLIPANQQSTQLAELEKRMDAEKSRQNGELTNAQANNYYNQQLLLKKAADAKKNQNAMTPGGLNGGGTRNGLQSPIQKNTPSFSNITGAMPGNSKNVKLPVYVAPPQSPQVAPKQVTTPTIVNGPLVQPSSSGDYVITSLATGVQASGLANVLKTAEKNMRSGKFTAALDSYDTAAAVAPNNPFVTLGRGFAELGASYYGKAEDDIRRTITNEPAVLVARYDLKGFLGGERLRFITQDLRDIAKSEKTASRAPFLLAYIEHNNGNDQVAEKDLNEAIHRAGGKDAVAREMQKLWGFPQK